MGAWRQDGLADTYVGRNVTLTLTLSRIVIVMFPYLSKTSSAGWQTVFDKLWRNVVQFNYTKQNKLHGPSPRANYTKIQPLLGEVTANFCG
jgi:hypothetical protein